MNFSLEPLDSGEFTFTVAFAPTGAKTSDFDEARELAKRHWEKFWLSGGAVEFAGSKDPRAEELERRVVLSPVPDGHSLRGVIAAAGDRVDVQ